MATELEERGETEGGHFQVAGREFTVYYSINETRIWEDGDDYIVTLHGRWDTLACKAAILGYFSGLKAGITQGSEKVRADLRTLLGVVSVAEATRLDRRIDDVEGQADQRGQRG